MNKIWLKDWSFALGDAEECLKDSKMVTVPHTWNIEEGSEEYAGIGWYRHELRLHDEWNGKRVFVRFKAVYHSAYVYLNGTLVGEHLNSGYTPFTIEITDALQWSGKNKLTVKVDNRFSETMLPYMRSFDWANDGGLIRDIELFTTGESRIVSCRVKSQPIIDVEGRRQDRGAASFALTYQLDSPTSGLTLRWSLSEGIDNQCHSIMEGVEKNIANDGTLLEQKLSDVRFWHFDEPQLYTLKIELLKEDEIQDFREIVFGFRSFEVKGSAFYFNGEKVRLCGTEWMPGSNPNFGSAETKEQLEKMLVILKESNCVFTRFHWQQDDIVYDWCNRHGMLVQEEIPFWGRNPELAGAEQMEVFKEQLREMVEAHGNHPSIIAWGVGNELNAQMEPTIQYISDAVGYAHNIDRERWANYMTNTIFEDPKNDGSIQGDIIMLNDYIGTWHGPLDQINELEKIIMANPSRAIVPSEFGLCEPAFSGGDPERIRIFNEKMKAYRQFDVIAATINFCLNDYRTQMGEDGVGKYRQRIHGSTDLYGALKPSYYSIQKECAPFTLQMKGTMLNIKCRNDIPSYMMKNYRCLIYDKNNHLQESLIIPELLPGDSFTHEVYLLEEVKVMIYRSNGDFCGSTTRMKVI